jgi:hypothetical protein
MAHVPIVVPIMVLRSSPDGPCEQFCRTSLNIGKPLGLINRQPSADQGLIFG